MYDDYFGLKQPPFKITPDTSLFFPGGNRGAVLEALVYAIMKGEGIVKVVGEVGSGKTMLCRMLETELPKGVDVVYLANPSLSPENILHAIAFELNLPIRPDSSRLQVMNRLQEYLLQRHAAGHQVVVFVEEAQSMPVATLEEIRLLSNLETQQDKLLQIVLFGQPELDQTIARPDIRQLKERITYSFLLSPFKFNDIRDYLNARLRACGHRSGEIFSRSAVKAIGRYSRGLVRRINILADKSLLAAYALNHHQVGAKHVKQAARDSEYIGHHQFWFWGAVVAVCLLFTTGIIGYWWLPAFNQAGERPVFSEEPGVLNHSGSVTEIAAGAVVEGGLRDSVGNRDRSSDGPQLFEGPVAGTIDAMEQDPGVAESGAAATAETGGKDGIEGSLAVSLMDPVNGDESQGGAEEFAVSSRELAVLKKQLELLPPEMAYQDDSSSGENICKRCWSIIYRPMVNAENL